MLRPCLPRRHSNTRENWVTCSLNRRRYPRILLVLIVETLRSVAVADAIVAVPLAAVSIESALFVAVVVSCTWSDPCSSIMN